MLCILKKGWKSWDAYVRIGDHALLRYYWLEPHGSKSLTITLEGALRLVFGWEVYERTF